MGYDVEPRVGNNDRRGVFTPDFTRVFIYLSWDTHALWVASGNCVSFANNLVTLTSPIESIHRAQTSLNIRTLRCYSHTYIDHVRAHTGIMAGRQTTVLKPHENIL